MIVSEISAGVFTFGNLVAGSPGRKVRVRHPSGGGRMVTHVRGHVKGGFVPSTTKVWKTNRGASAAMAKAESGD